MLPMQRSLFQLRAVTAQTRPLVMAVAAKIQDVHPSTDSKALNVSWADGTHGSFPYIWLRDCAKKQQPSYLNDLSLTVRPENFGIQENGEKLLIQWPPYCMVSYDSQWLRNNVAFVDTDTVDALQTANKAVTLWDRDSFPTNTRFSLPELTLDPSPALRFLHRFGFLHLSHVDSSPIDVLKHALNFQAVSCGEEEVQDLSQTRSIATHGVTQKETPRYYCILAEKAGKTGNFQMVDGFKVATEFKLELPEVFEFASHTPITYCGEEGSEVLAQHPLFTLDSDGRIHKVAFNNDARCLVHVPQKKYKLYYKAILEFHNLCYAQRNLVDVHLWQGDLLLLDNTRVLSGSTAFSFNPTRAEYRLGCFSV